jgi:hypothetical protein
MRERHLPRTTALVPRRVGMALVRPGIKSAAIKVD